MSTLHERFVDMDARTRRKCQGLYWTPTAFPALAMTVYRAFTRSSEDIPLVWDILEKQKIPTTFVEGIFLGYLINSR